MADIYLDEDVSEKLALLLEAEGHDVMTARNLRSKGQDDVRQLLPSIRLGRILITHNGADFLLLQIAWRLWAHEWDVSARVRHPGILVVPQPPRLAVHDAPKALADVLHDSPRLANKLMAWKPPVGWQQVG